jgi:mxaC protein
MAGGAWLAFTHPAWLWALPLGGLPWLGHGMATLRPIPFASVQRLPADRPSQVLAWGLRAAGSLAIAATLLALAHPYRPEYEQERQGQGAEIVLLLDRSRSMDQSQLSSTGPMANYTPNYSIASRHTEEERMTKAEVARRALAQFAARRHNDRFAMIMFSTQPLKVLDFTQKPDVIQAAITAGAVGRGVSNTDIGQAMLAGLALFEGRPYTGSRVLLLVSDGGDHIEPEVRDRLAQLLRKHRVGLNWIYIRSPLSPGLNADADMAPDAADTVPEYFLHRFFKTLATPYRAYEADNAQAVDRAIADVDKLENLPITYTDTVPRRDLSPACLAVALLAAGALLLAKRAELPAWT